MKRTLVITGPILPGSISTSSSRCGKPNCACKGKPPHLHGPYYRWTGFIAGVRTTRTLGRQEALECERRTRNFRKLQRQLDRLVQEALAAAPWVSHASTLGKGGTR